MNASAVPQNTDELRTVVARAEQLLEALQDTGDDAVDALRSRATEAVNSAKRRLQSVRNKTRDTVIGAANAADDYVRENPWQTIAVGALFGLFVGALLVRRN